MSDEASAAPLPLSQQVLAWLLVALGFATDAPVSAGTLKNAQRGRRIAQKWEDLAAGFLALLEEEQHREARSANRLPEYLEQRRMREQQMFALLHQWDELVGSLPAAGDLSLAERLNTPLRLLIPQLGVRLGALAVIVAARRQAPLADCMWLVEPLDRRFFGRVVRTLLDDRFSGTTNEQLKGVVGDTVDWRTIERWFAGDVDVPNTDHLVHFGDLLGDRAEWILRGARLAAKLRVDLHASIGEPMTTDLAQAIAAFARSSAALLSSRAGLTALLGWFHEELTGANAAAVHANLTPFLPPDLRDRPAPELAGDFAAASTLSERSPLVPWVLTTTLLAVHPRLIAEVCPGPGGDLRALLAMADVRRVVESMWSLLMVLGAVERGDAAAFKTADGRPAVELIPPAAREKARRLRTDALRFTTELPEAHPTIDLELVEVLIEVFGPSALGSLVDLPAAFNEHLTSLIAPTAEPALPDELVAESASLSLARARRLAESGDSHLALQWYGRARACGAPRSAAEADDLLAMLAAIGHTCVDQVRRLRAALRDDAAAEAMTEGDLTMAIQTLQMAADLGEKLLAATLQLGYAPAGTHARLAQLVEIVPLAIRVALLRDDASEDGDAGYEAVRALVEEAVACLERQPAQGRGWAIVALWERLCALLPAEVAAERRARDARVAALTKQVTHHGSGDFLESQWTGILADLGLTEDAG
jgi:hypothetical protein